MLCNAKVSSFSAFIIINTPEKLMCSNNDPKYNYSIF